VTNISQSFYLQAGGKNHWHEYGTKNYVTVTLCIPTVTRLSTNRARRTATSLMRPTSLPHSKPSPNRAAIVVPGAKLYRRVAEVCCMLRELLLQKQKEHHLLLISKYLSIEIILSDRKTKLYTVHDFHCTLKGFLSGK